MCSVVIFYIVLFSAVYVVVVVNVAVVLMVDRWNESLVPKEYTVKVLIAYIELCGVDQSFLADHLFVQSQQYFYAIKVVKKKLCHSCANLYVVNEITTTIFLYSDLLQ